MCIKSIVRKNGMDETTWTIGSYDLLVVARPIKRWKWFYWATFGKGGKIELEENKIEYVQRQVGLQSPWLSFFLSRRIPKLKRPRSFRVAWEGVEAFENHIKPNECPYPKNSSDASDWRLGAIVAANLYMRGYSDAEVSYTSDNENNEDDYEHD